MQNLRFSIIIKYIYILSICDRYQSTESSNKIIHILHIHAILFFNLFIEVTFVCLLLLGTLSRKRKLVTYVLLKHEKYAHTHVTSHNQFGELRNTNAVLTKNLFTFDLRIYET